MSSTYDEGWAIIHEGSTEKVFYLCLLKFLCKKHGASIQKEELNNGLEIIYTLKINNRKYIIKTYDAGSLTNMPKTSKWFEEESAKKYLKKSLWTVFLCYDTDAYKYEVSPYYEGDWKDLRDKIGKVKEIVDLAAAADIEDVLLMDFEGICKYIGVEKPDRSLLKGRKGSAKMKALFRSYGKTYHKGERTQSLIENLDLQKIIDSNILPLSQIEAAFQGKNDF